MLEEAEVRPVPDMLPQVVINGLFSAECESFTYQRPVKSLALDAKFSRKGNRHFASGGLAGQVEGDREVLQVVDVCGSAAAQREGMVHEQRQGHPCW